MAATTVLCVAAAAGAGYLLLRQFEQEGARVYATPAEVAASASEGDCQRLSLHGIAAGSVPITRADLLAARAACWQAAQPAGTEASAPLQQLLQAQRAALGVDAPPASQAQ